MGKMFVQLLVFVFVANAVSSEIVNEPAVKSIHVSPHEIYDCVDIYKQPAFNNPLLKNHKLQLKPSHVPDGIHEEKNPIVMSGFEEDECPVGTVPIRRSSKNDLIRPRIRKPKYEINRPKPFGTFVNHVATYSTNEGTFYGASARFNIWKPMPAGPQQFSMLKMVLQGFRDGSTEPREVIEAGWAVYPELYLDNDTRITTSWTIDGYRLTGCYNLLCELFMQVNNKISLGGKLAPISQPGGTQGNVPMRVYEDGQTGNWWLCIPEQCIGYWPPLFRIVGKGRMVVSWGGEIMREASEATSPPMGSGRTADAGLGFAAYVSSVQLVKQAAGLPEIVAKEEVHANVDAPQCYSVGGFDEVTIPPNGDSGSSLGDLVEPVKPSIFSPPKPVKTLFHAIETF